MDRSGRRRSLQRKKEKNAKVQTAKTTWVPAVNNLGTFGRWAFPEIDGSNLVSVHTLNWEFRLCYVTFGSNEGGDCPCRRAWQHAVTNSNTLRSCWRHVATTDRILAT